MIRFFDIVFSFIGLILLLPVFAVVALFIVTDSKGEVFYKQTRVGKNKVGFELYKFRTMAKGSDKKSLITIGANDSRITKVGFYLRKYKLDELPQLINVLRGDMSLVGPRPEVKKYVDLYTIEQEKVLSVRPGITDYASIEYIDENVILGNVANPDQVYVEQIMPRKIQCNMKYINNHTIKEYFKIIFSTFRKIFGN